jgi:hypothetical protein
LNLHGAAVTLDVAFHAFGAAGKGFALDQVYALGANFFTDFQVCGSANCTVT